MLLFHNDNLEKGFHVKKVLKLPRIEEQFRRSMIDKIRGKNND